jgi:DNA-binding LacI/PurR family transcriptional regulator
MQATLKTPDKASRMIDYLQENIHGGRIKQGARIPSLRQLKEQFDISLGTAKRGIDYLCHKGILESNQGSGTFVKKSSQSYIENHTHRIIVLIPWINDQTGILHSLYSGIFEEGSNQKIQLLLSYIDFKDIEIEALKRMTDGYSALILLGEYDTVLQERLSIKMPVLASGMQSNLDGSASLFEMDIYQSAELAVEYFKKHNISHVKCYSGNAPVGIARLQQFQLLWEATGRTVEFRQSASNKYTSEFKFKPEGAFLFSSGWLMNAFCKRYKAEFNIQLSDEATILGFDGRSCVDPNYYPAPTIYTDWKQIGHDMFIECMQRIKNPGMIPRRYYYPVKLITPTCNKEKLDQKISLSI